jgi:hypothetical protein
MSNSVLENLGYNQAQAGDTLEDRAREAMATMAGFPDKISEEHQASLYIGYIRRYNETHPAKTYAVVDGNYVLATDEMIANKKIEKLEIGVHYARSFSTHEYGRMGTENPKLKDVIKEIREASNKYCSNRLSELKNKASKLIKLAQGGNRRETKSFTESIESVFEQLEKSVKTKSSRGDASANPVKFKVAMAAFWKAYKA